MRRAGSSAWMEKDLFPWIGSLPLQDITAPLLLQALRRIEGRGANETAHTLRQTAGQVFRYGIATGRCERNPSPDLHGALRPIVVKHMAAVLEPAGVYALMRAIVTYVGQPLTRAALELSALTFQRPGNIRQMGFSISPASDLRTPEPFGQCRRGSSRHLKCQSIRRCNCQSKRLSLRESSKAHHEQQRDR
jgi:integrase